VTTRHDKPEPDPRMTTAEQAKAQKTPSDSLSPQRLMALLAQMMLIRRFEERTMQAYMQQKIGGFCHIYIGQEAVAVGSIAALREDDPIVGAYRDHGLALAKGMDPNYAMAEMFGKVTGCSKGKGGSMHLFDRPHHMYGGHAIVGGQVPLGAGIAFGIQYEKKPNVCLCYLGDGALNQGAFHESLNLASIWNLPILFVLENNMYSMGTHIGRGTSMAEDLGAKAEAYGLRYAECDGLDVLDVYNCFTREVENTRNAANPQWKRGTIPEYVRGGKTPGPAFINVRTYRYKGHSMSDPQKYRSKDEVSDVEKNDCINRLVSHLVEHDLATQEQIDDLDKKAKTRAQEAVKFADQSEDITREQMYTDVYSNPFPPFKKGGPAEGFREK
jgi:pyruvate dehydrogenase E1 component alpha subunit